MQLSLQHMNNTNAAAIKSMLHFYNETYDVYSKNNTIDSKELISKIPDNLKTPAKLAMFNTFGENITQLQFIRLLMYQTTGADLINIVYVARYYNLKYDNNQMLIWTEECPYTSFKQETVNNWYIWHVLNTHAMFSKYSTLCEFKLQARLECNIFAPKENFRDDLYFPNLHLINATNEAQHLTMPQRILDAEKIALNKMNGNSVISLYTTSLVDVKSIKKTMQIDLCANKDEVLQILLNSICTAHNVIDVKSINIIRTHMVMKIRSYFNIVYVLKSHTKNVNKFNALVNSSAINDTTTQVLNEYLIVVNQTIHEQIYNNNYLKCYKSTLLDIVLSSCLHDFNFRQDYIQVILGENLVDLMRSDVNYLQHIEIIVLAQQPRHYQDMYDTKVNLYKKYKKISEQFIDKPIDFVNLFNLKLKSLREPNNDCVITFAELCKLFKCKTQVDIENIKIIIYVTCNIGTTTQNNEIYISWKQLQRAIFASKEIKLQQLLLFYYTEVDSIYEIIISRLQQDAKRFICTPDNYNNYTGRLYKKFSTAINKYKTFAKNMLKHNAGLNGIINELRGTSFTSAETLPTHHMSQPAKTVLEPLLGFVEIIMPDATRLAHTNIRQRISDINTDFTMLTEKYVVVKNDIDTDFVDPDDV